MEPLLGKTLDELRDVADRLGMPRFAASQMAQWIYHRRTAHIDAMSNLSKDHRDSLRNRYVIGRVPPVEAATSTDGTVKYLFAVAAGHPVEAVYIPDGDRATLCVSTQAGCRMGCRFCMTGQQGWHGNLTAAEILNQIFSVPQSDRLTNLVFMGMGEPLDNADAVLQALHVITAPWGMAWSPRRVTVSTVGVLPQLPRLIAESECHLAISLHSPFADERETLMPVQRAWPAAEVIDLLRRHDFGHQRHLTFEYIVFRGLNDTMRHARALARLVGSLPCRVNLIRFHAIPDSRLNTSDEAAMIAFRDELNRHGVTATIRASRGEDIFAACGMLSGQHGSERKS